MIDPATGWFKMKEIKDKTAINVADVVEQTWLTRYPWPTQIVYDKGTEFMAEFAKMIKDDYGIRKSPASVRNPQANYILERIHQTIGNVIRTFKFDEKYMDPTILSRVFYPQLCLLLEQHTILPQGPPLHNLCLGVMPLQT